MESENRASCPPKREIGVMRFVRMRGSSGRADEIETGATEIYLVATMLAEGRSCRQSIKPAIAPASAAGPVGQGPAGEPMRLAR